MTDKQLNFLKKHLNENSLSKLKSVDNRHISSLIDTIIKTSNVEMFTKKEVKEILTPVEISTIELHINNHIETYSKIKDEKATITNVFYLLGVTYYRMEQYWFKGESNSRSYNWFFIDENYKLFDITPYDIMVEKGVYTMQGLFNLILNRW